MAKSSTQTISIALVEADAAIAVLESAISGKVSEADIKLLTRAREALAIAEGRVNDMRELASRLNAGL